MSFRFTKSIGGSCSGVAHAIVADVIQGGRMACVPYGPPTARKLDLEDPSTLVVEVGPKQNTHTRSELQL